MDTDPLKAVLGKYDSFTDRNTRDNLLDCRDRGSHARSVYPTQDTSCIETARVKQEVGPDTRIIEELKDIWKKGT